jgi:hypothetical protein
LKQTTLVQASRDGVAGIANIISGIADDDKVVRPHMMLLRPRRKVVPLSVELRGSDAMRAFPGGTFADNADLVVEYVGEETRDGLRCHIVAFTNTSKATKAAISCFKLWLAEEKNYIPLRMESYDSSFSRDVPLAEGTVTEWRELKSGIWFPMRVEILHYDHGQVQRDQKKVLDGSWTYACDKVSLEPRYDAAYFQAIKIPAGTAVYEIEDKKVKHSYRQGQPGTGS